MRLGGFSSRERGKREPKSEKAETENERKTAKDFLSPRLNFCVAADRAEETFVGI